MTVVEDDLFAGLDVAGIVVEKPASDDNRKADEAWAQWSKLTRRPQQRNPERDFVKGYKALLADGHQHGKLMVVIAGAARMPVRPRDPRDIRRLLYALQSPNGTKEALALLHEKQRAIVPFPDETDFKATVSELEKACRIPAADWTAGDHDACAVLITRYDAERLQELADDTARYLGSEGVLPTDLLRRAHKSASYLHRKQLKEGMYDAGRAEDEEFAGIAFDADNLAEDMRRKGAPAAEIRRLHEMAPAGYWDAALDTIIDQPTMTFTSIYDRLTEKYKWHPDMRLSEEA